MLVALTAVLIGAVGLAAAVSARLAGDVTVGGLFAVHGSGAGAGCGPLVREHYGIQRVEAALLALDRLRGAVPGVRVGAELRDSCWAPHTALRQAMLLAAPERCGPRAPHAPLLGVLGPGASSAAAQVQNLLQLFAVPQVSYSATSRELSDRARFATFFRVVPPDTHQARVLLAVLRAHNWTYVHALYTDESYGQSGMAAFRELAAAAGVCVARSEPLRALPSEREVDAAVSRVVSAAGGSGRSRVAVCWCEGRTARALLGGLARRGVSLRLVGSDGWADRADVVAGLEGPAEGALTIKIRSPPLPGFDRRYLSLSPHNNSRNPWFREFWEQKFSCSLEPTPADGRRHCTGGESLREGHTQEPKLALVVRGVYALTYALRDMHAALCPLRAGLCDDITPFNLTLYKEFLSRVRFRAPDGGLVAFDENGDPPAEASEYDVMSFGRHDGRWRYVREGAWRNGRLKMKSAGAVRQRAGESRAACSPPCPRGHYRQAAGDDARCCWACVPCPPLHVPHSGDRAGCRACPPGHVPDTTRTRCAPSPLEWGAASGWAQAAVGVAAAGGLAGAVLTAAALWRHRDTPVVKAASRELCALLLAAASLCHSSALAALARPTPGACVFVRLAAPALAGTYAAVLARTLRIARLVAAARSPGSRPRLLSSRAQVAVWSALTAPGAAAALWASAAWGVTPAVWHPARSRAALRCGGSEPGRLLGPLAPAFALLSACALLAVRTRRLPHNFNEARFIGAAVYATCLVWIAFVPMFAVTEAKTLAVCGCVSLSAGACVALTLWPRVWVCVFRPRRNTRAHFITARSIRCHVGRYAPAAAAGSRERGVQAGGAVGAGGARVVELRTGPDTADVIIALVPLPPNTSHLL